MPDLALTGQQASEIPRLELRVNTPLVLSHPWLNAPCAAFHAELVELAITQTKKNGEFTIPGLGKLVKAQRVARMARSAQDQGRDDRKFRLAKSAKDAVVPPKPK